MIDSSKKIKLFISYSHDDEVYFKVLSDGLKKVIRNSQHFEWQIWDDTKIHVGTFWDDEIQNNIKDCNIALLLVSIGFMSSSYIKEKEFDEFKKRYAENGILIFPVVFRPCDFNLWEDLGKLQFFKPKGSDYGKSSIPDFTYADLIKFTETDGTLLPSPSLDRYHLALFRKVEESYGEFIIRNETDLKIETTEEAIVQPAQNINKSSDYPRPNALFTGREDEIFEFNKAFEKFRIFALEGLGGSGKTQLAAKFIEDNLEAKERIIWLNGSSQSNFDVFVESIGYGDVLKGKEKTNLEIYSGLKDLIEKDKRIIFWDNYNDYEDSSFAEFLSFANSYLRYSTVILITKTNPIIGGVTSLPSIKIEGLSNDAIEYAKKLKSSNPKYNSISEIDLEKICDAVDGHPLAIELSMLLIHYGESVDEIILHLPEYSTSKVEEFSKRLFLDILFHPKTSSEERECFLKCSVLKGKFTSEEIKYLNGEADVFSIITGLIDKLLISSKQGFYEIHPLVRSFSYEKLDNKKSIHDKAADYYISKRDNSLNIALEEKILYHLTRAENWFKTAESIEKNGRDLIKFGLLGLLFEVIAKLTANGISRDIFNIYLGDICQIKCEWDNAIIYYKKVIDQSSKNVIIAEGIIKLGEIYFRKSDYADALVLFNKGHEFSKKHDFKKELARALNDIGLIYYEYNQLDLARKYFYDALKIREDINDIDGVCSTNNNLANVYDKNKKYGEAIKIQTKNIKIATDTNDKLSLVLYTMNMCGVLRKQGKLDEALEKVKLALEINQGIGEKAILGYGLVNWGLILLSQGKLIEGKQRLDEAFIVYNEIGHKKGILSYYINIGLLLQKEKKYTQSLISLFLAVNITRQMGTRYEEIIVIETINSIKKEIGKLDFKSIVEEAKKGLKSEYDNDIDVVEFLNEPIIRMKKKYNRNDIIKVQFNDKTIKEGKFKSFEAQILNGKCEIID